MNVVVQITYNTEAGKVLQRGEFPSKRRTPEQVALEWWKQLKRESIIELELVKVIINGEDKTDTIKNIRNHNLISIDTDNKRRYDIDK